ncbi:MAG: universal stress protein [Halorubrum sp.]
MSADHDDTPLLGHVLVPVASPTDAVGTAAALQRYQPTRVTVLHVVEKTAGAPDKTSVAHSEEVATESFDAFRGVFPEADDHVAYAEDVVEAIFAAADDVGATAIAYQALEGNRLMQFLSGDRSLRLVTKAELPVIALPSANEE